MKILFKKLDHTEILKIFRITSAVGLFLLIGSHNAIKAADRISENTIMQQRAKTISGRIVDSQGTPIIGASVVVKGKSVGAMSDADGNFSLEVQQGSVIVVSYIGYVKQQVTVGSKSSFIITLQEDTQTLDEVVVVGYGTQKKVNLTGAIATTSGNTLQKYISPNTASALQGQLPGLQITQNSGQPGAEGVNMQVRGYGSFGSSNTPLIVVDGIPTGVMPTSDNIESVTVLKDASSASIYGSRAAGGVILITTKRGKSGKANIDYSFNLAFNEATKIPDLITNSADYMTLYNQANDHSGIKGRNYSQADIEKYRNNVGNPLYPNTDWMSLLFRTATSQTHSLTVSGGNDKTTYSFNFNYVDQPGVQRGYSYRRLSSQTNIETQISKRIKAGVNISMSYGHRLSPGSEDSGQNSIFQQFMSQAPTYSPYLADGSGRYTENAYPSSEYNIKTNPILTLDLSKKTYNSYYTQIHPYLQVQFTDWLSWDINGSFTYNFSKEKQFGYNANTYNFVTNELSTNRSATQNKGLTVSDGNSISPLLFSTLKFNKTFGAHTIGAMVGMQIEYSKSESLGAGRQLYTTSDTQEINAGSLSKISNSGTANESSLLSYFGRLNYSYKDKYLLEFNMRADASSRFAKENRWGYFPSVSVGWRPFEETFIPKISWVDDLKLRASYGSLGNLGGSLYPYQSVMSSNGLYYSYDGSTISSGMAVSGLVNKSISWEVTKVFDFGIDLTLLKNQLFLSFDYFHKKTTGILRRQQLIWESGYSNSSPYVNSGAMQNTGFELSAEYRGKIDKVNFGVKWNIQTFKNKVTKFGDPEITSNGESIPTIIEEGKPYGSFYLYDWGGIFQSQAEADASGQTNKPQAGDLKINDHDGVAGISSNDKILVDGKFPKWSTGITLSANWKNLDVTAFFYGTFGQKIFVYGSGFEPFFLQSIPTKDWLNAWTPENKSNSMPAVYDSQHYRSAFNTYPSTYNLQNNSFFRLKNLNIGWTFNTGMLTNNVLKSVRIYFSGENLFTITKFKGLDPERAGNGGYYVAYPQNRVYSFGVNVKF